MAEKREPYIEGHRVDSSVSTTVSDSKVKVYVGIEADTGTYDLTYQQTPKLFVQEYSTKSKPDTNDASTLLHAGKLVENFGIYVKRVNKDSILPGIVSTGKYGEVGYFDTNFNPINNYTQFKFVPDTEEKDTQKLAMVIDNVLYINSNVTNTTELDAIFTEKKPYYLTSSENPVEAPMKVAIDEFLGGRVFDEVFTENTPVLVTKTIDNAPVGLFYVINVGRKFGVEEFLAEVTSWAKNYRSEVDPVEFIEYEPTSLLMSMDVSAIENPDKVEVLQACDLLANKQRLVKNFTKLEFIDKIEDSESPTGYKYLLTDTDYRPKGSYKYLDVSNFRYIPNISGNDNVPADNSVTLKKCSFGDSEFIESNELDLHCTVSDAILASIDSMVSDNDTIKPELAYCSTEQVFKIKYKETSQGMTIVSSAVVSDSTNSHRYLVNTGFYGEGFKKSLVNFEYLDINGDWVEVKPGTSVSNELIDDAGYAYIRLKFNGKINAIGSEKAGIAIVYSVYNQSGSTVENEYHVAFIGKNVSKDDISEFAEVSQASDCTYENILLSKITSNTTDLGIICNLINVSLNGSDYKFKKVRSDEVSYNKDIPALYDNSKTYNVGDKCSYEDKYYTCTTKITTAEEWKDEHWEEYELPVYTVNISSIVNKLYLYFLKSRNITFGVTGYDVRCWKKFTDIYQKNYFFDSQDEVSEGVASYYAVLVNNTVYFNGIEGETAQIPSDWSSEIENKVTVSTIELKPSEFIDALDEKIRNQFSTFAKLSDGNYIVGQPIDTPKTSGRIKVIDYNKVNQTELFNSARYAIIQKFTSAAKLFGIKITFDKTDKEILRFVNSYNGTEYTDKISFNVGKIDGYGTNISYKSYNLYDDRSLFIKELNPQVPVIEMEVPSFGDDIAPKKATSQDYVNALDDLVSDEFKPSFLWDAGLCDTSYTNALTSLADKTYSMVPISVPKECESVSEIKNWKSAFNVDNPVQYILDGWHYNTVFGDISFECCPTYYYLVVKLSNANSISKEFQTAFYKTRGIVSAGTPVRNVPLKKSEREDLLDLRVNSIVRNKANSISYINQNFTNQQVESDFSEEQNVCISNEVCRTADDYADNNIIAKNNTENLRTTVTSELTRLIRERIMDSRGDDTAQSFYVECNKVNNPDSIVKARKLVIDIFVTYNKSVNAVLVYSRTKSLDQG